MKRFTIIITRDSKVLLSSEQYLDWLEVQDAFENYMTSVDFENLEDLMDYLENEYKLTKNKCRELVLPISQSINKTIQLEF